MRVHVSISISLAISLKSPLPRGVGGPSGGAKGEGSTLTYALAYGRTMHTVTCKSLLVWTSTTSPRPLPKAPPPKSPSGQTKHASGGGRVEGGKGRKHRRAVAEAEEILNSNMNLHTRIYMFKKFHSLSVNGNEHKLLDTLDLFS